MAHKNRRTNPRFAFLNIPYDSEFESLYLAFIAGLSAFGLIPRVTLQITGSQRRLDRILSLIDNCSFSFHDLSSIKPRFNMPFELGLATARAWNARRNHTLFVFEAKKYRLQKTLSDLNGTDIYVHGGTATGVLRQLTNALERIDRRPTVRDLKQIYHDLRQAAEGIKADLEVQNLFDARPFADLVIAANRIASFHMKIPRAKTR